MSHFKGRKIQEPSLHIENVYGSSLTALSDAWASVAEAKKELKNVDSRIRQSSVHPMTWHPYKNVKDPITEKTYHKENIPPVSYPKPTHVEPYGSDLLENSIYTACSKQYTSTEPQKISNLHMDPEENNEKLGVSLTGKSLLTQQSKSVALSRLKEKINLQKQQLSFDDSNEKYFPSKLYHEESEAVKRSDEPDTLKIITRKIGHAPSAPVYRGFNEPLSINVIDEMKKYVNAKEVRKKTQKEVVKKLSPKNQTKNKGKPHRIIAPKKSTSTINAMSWRVGQEIQRKVCQEFYSNKDSKINREETNTIKSASVSHNAAKSDSVTNNTAESDSSTSNNEKSDFITNNTAKSNSETHNTMKSDSVTCNESKKSFEDHDNSASNEIITDKKDDNGHKDENVSGNNDGDITLKEQSIDSDVEGGELEKDISHLLESKLLTENAREILQNVNIEKEPSIPLKKKQITATIDTGLIKKLANKSPPVKRKLEDETYPKTKVRHYDQEEVKRYMLIQQNQRKKQMLDEKRKEKEKKASQDKKLQELYAKQKAAVRIESKHPISETFIKSKQRKLESMLQCEQEKYKSSIQSEQEKYKSCMQAQSRSSADASSFTVPKQTSSPCGKSSLDTNSSRSLVSETKESVPICESSVNLIETKSGLEKSKADRINAIRTTAAALRQRLDEEAMRLTSLVQKKQTRENSPKKTVHYDIIDNEIPGVQNLEEKSRLIKKKNEMDDAAKLIQAAYRGHCVRQSLSWQLPSGLTLYQSLEEAKRKAFLNDIQNKPVELISSNFPPVVLLNNYEYSNSFRTDESSSLAKNALQSLSLPGDISLQETIPSDSLNYIGLESYTDKKPVKDSHNSNTAASNSYTAASHSYNASSNSYNVASNSEQITDRKSNNIHSEEQIQRLRNILEKHKDTYRDKYSIINIFTRNYAGYKNVKTGETQQDDYTPLHTESDSSTLSKGSKHIVTVQSSTDSEMGVFMDENNILSKKGEISRLASYLESKGEMSQEKLEVCDLSEHSEKLFSPSSRPSDTNLVPKTIADEASDYSSDTCNSIVDELFSDEINPILTSTRRFPNKKSDKNHESFLHQNINQFRGRMSPNTLERRLRAEINLFDNVGDTMQQVDEMEKIQNIINAQQQSVALAQVLKSRQLTHKHDLEKLSMEAKEKAMISTKDVESARLATAEASVKALQMIADIKLKAAEEATENAKKIVQVHENTTAIALDAANKVDKSRNDLTEAYRISVERQLYDVEKVAVAAASAASVAAVNAALEHHKQQLERLRMQSLAKISKLYSPTDSTSSKVSQTKILVENRTTSLSQSKSYDVSKTAEGSSSQTKMLTKESSITSSKSTHRLKDSISFVDSVVAESIYSNSASNNVNNDISKLYDDIFISSKHISREEVDEKSENSIAEKLYLNELVSQSSSAVKSQASSISFKKVTSSSTNIGEEREKIINIDNNDSGEKSFSNVSFSSRITEEDVLKNDFRMVLPSENHRRKSLDSKDITSTNEQSSSDNTKTPKVNKRPRRHSKSPFAEEDTFSRFTVDMVRQYIQEEEMRAKHQKALLALREKAIIEKTKAEMAFLEMKKKSFKKKGSDDMMPPITKKQRVLLMKLQAEQAEIRRQKETLKVAKHERKSMLNQQREIQRIRSSTQIIWNKLGGIDKNSLSFKEDVSETNKSGNYKNDLDSSANSVLSNAEESESTNILSDIENKNTSSRLSAIDVEINKVHVANHAISLEDQSSFSQDFQKLRNITSERYLTEREKKLQLRKDQFSKILERENKLKSWREKIIEEEQKLKAEIKRVLNTDARINFEKNISASQHSSAQTNSKSSYQTSSPSKQVDVASSIASLVHERHSSAGSISPISESVSLERRSQQTSSREASSKFVVKSISQESKSLIVSNKSNSPYDDEASIKENILTETLKTHLITSDIKTEEILSQRNKSIEKKSKKITKSSLSSKVHRDYSDSYSNEIFEDTSAQTSPIESKKTNQSRTRNKRIDEESTTEGTSDVSDIEQRLKGLENELQRRRDQLNHLRRRKEKEVLKKKEIEMKKELQLLEQQIRQEKTAETSACPARTQSPRILSPRSSLEASEKNSFSDKDSRRSLNFYDQDNNDANKVDQQRKSSSKNLSSNSVNIDSTKVNSKLTDSILSNQSINELVREIETREFESSTSIEKNEKSESINKSIEKSISESSFKSIEKSISKNGNKSIEISISENIHKSIEGSVTKNLNKSSEKSIDQYSTKSIQTTVEEKEYYDDIFEHSLKSSSRSSNEHISSISKQLTDSLGVKPLETTKLISNNNDHSLKSDRSTTNHLNFINKSIKDDISKTSEKGKTTISSYGFNINDRIIVEGRLKGTVMYIGKISNSDLIVAGVALDEPNGTCNGTFNGHKYFDCHDNYGLFIKIENLAKISDLVLKGVNERENASFKNSENCLPASFVEEDITEKFSDITDLKSSEIHSRTNTPDVESIDELTEPKSHISQTSYKSLHRSTDLVIKSDYISSSHLSPKENVSVKSCTSKSVESCSSKSVYKSEVNRLNEANRSLNTSHSTSLKSEIISVSNEGDKSLSLSGSTSNKDHFHESDINCVETVDNRPNNQPINTNYKTKLLHSNTADHITDSLLKSLLTETVNISKDKAIRYNKSESVKTSIITELAINTLLNDAISHMINVGKRKSYSLRTIPDNFPLLQGTKNHLDISLEAEKHPDITEKIRNLKTVHDELDALLKDSDSGGDSDSDLDEEVRSSNIILPPRGFDSEDPMMHIPYTEKETTNLVLAALKEMENLSLGEITIIKPSNNFLTYIKNDHDRNSILYCQLVFDVSKSLYHDIMLFRQDHTQSHPLLFQKRRKNYSKFTRTTNQLVDENEIRSTICAHVCTILGLRPGRPSLEKLKHKLPLNLAKKDYVDAILVDELREEEIQWVNYDEDELRVKFQLADAILENLLCEITTFLSSVCK